MNFFQTIKDSIYNPAFYKSIPSKPLSFALSYFLKLILVLSLLNVLAIVFPVASGVTALTNKELPRLIASFPANLQVKIVNSQASTNVTEPYFIALPPSDSQENYKNLLVINTKVPFSNEEFKAYDTLALLTRDAIYYQDQASGQIRASSLSRVNNVTIDREHLSQVLNKFSPYFKFIIPVLLIVFFVLFLIGSLFRLIYLFVLSFIIYLLARIIDKQISYQNAYKVSLFAITLGLIVDLIVSALSPILHFHGFPLMVTIISSIVFLMNFKTQKEKK